MNKNLIPMTPSLLGINQSRHIAHRKEILDQLSHGVLFSSNASESSAPSTPEPVLKQDPLRRKIDCFKDALREYNKLVDPIANEAYDLSEYLEEWPNVNYQIETLEKYQNCLKNLKRSIKELKKSADESEPLKSSLAKVEVALNARNKKARMLKKYLKEIGAEGVREDEVCRGNFAEELNHLKALLDKELANNSEEESSG